MEFSIRTEPVCITVCCLGVCSVIAHIALYGGQGHPLATHWANTIIAFIVIKSIILILKTKATIIKDENEAGTPGQGMPSQDGQNDRQGRNRRHHNHQRWNNNNNASGGKFWGKTKEIKHDTFDNTRPHDAVLFNKSLKNIANYLQLQHGNDVLEAVRNMAPVTIIIPCKPTGRPDPNDSSKTLPVDDMDMHIWKCTFLKAHDRKDTYDENMAKAFIVIFHQCSPALKNDPESATTFASIRSNQDVIRLLKLIQSLCCSYNAKTQSVMATVASHKRLFTHYQKDSINNHTYHREFLAHVETIETYGGLGSVGVIPTFLKAKIIWSFDRAKPWIHTDLITGS